MALGSPEFRRERTADIRSFTKELNSYSRPCVNNGCRQRQIRELR